MADALWPLGLPQAPRLSSIQENPPELTIRSEMDTGQAKVRLRATAGPTVFPNLELKLTRTQIALLEDFFYTTLKAGALVFEWKHPRTGETREFRFLGAPKWQPNQPRNVSEQERYTVSFSVEMLPPIPEGDGGGGDPGNVCQKMFGATGSTIWGTESTLTVVIRSACQGTTAFYNITAVTRTFVYEAAVLDGSDQLLSLSWIYESPTGTISRITFHRDTGWSYNIHASHRPAPVCGADDTAGPDTGTEDGVFVVNKATAEADNVWAAKFCPGTTNAWFKTLDVTHVPNGCPTNAARATGFRAYVAICTITTLGGGSFTGRVGDLVQWGELKEEMAVS